MLKCPFCGLEFEDNEGIACCRGCPMSRTCSKVKCPNCGYENLKEPILIKLLIKAAKRLFKP